MQLILKLLQPVQLPQQLLLRIVRQHNLRHKPRYILEQGKIRLTAYQTIHPCICRRIQVLPQLLPHILSRKHHHIRIKYLFLQHFIQVPHTLQLIHLLNIISHLPRLRQVHLSLLKTSLQMFLTTLLITINKLHQQALQH